MKVLLVRHHDTGHVNTRLPASLNAAQGIYPPLGLAYIGAYLEKEGHNVSILDSQAENLTTEETKTRIKYAEPDIVGVTAMTPTVPGALEILKLTKDIDKAIITVIGGPQLSVYPRETVSYSYVDYGIIGEGEQAMAELLEDLGSKRTSTIKGLVTKAGINGFREPNRELDKLPPPARHLLPMSQYSCIVMKHPMTTMITARGCPFNCSFCFKDRYLQTYRIRNVEAIVDEMEECVTRYKVKEIGFYDDCFPSKIHLRDLCNELIRRNLKIPWETPQRTDLVDQELLQLMKQAGCIRIRYGVESGNARILKLMNKKTNLKDVEKVFKWTKAVGIETFAYFMIGYPTENKTTIEHTIEFAKKINPDWVMFTVATPLPMTRLMEQSGDIVNPDYWKNFTLGNNSERIPYLTDDADKFCREAYKSFYLKPSFILKELAKLRSYDQLKKHIRGGLALLRFRMV